MNVLLVDDSVVIRTRLAELLSALPGVGRVDAVARAADVWRAIHVTPPDVIVVDIHMPGGFGIEVLDALRASREQVVVMVLTNDPTPEWRSTCLRAGADFFFDKSMEFQRLIDIIAGLALGRAASDHQLPPCWTCFEGLPIPAWVVDAETRAFTAVNDAALARYGYSRQQFLTMTMADIELPGPGPTQAIGARPAGAAGPWVGTEQHRAEDGSIVHVEIAVTQVLRAGKRLDLVLAHDIGERKRLEQGLRQALKMEAIGRLAGGVAHDFNNLLTVIMGHSQEVIDRVPPGDPTHADAVQILNAGTYAADLTRQLLAFSRQQILAPRVLDLNAVVGRLAPMLRRLIGEHVELAIHVESDRLAVKADPGQLEQVIMNLVVNARDAMLQGGTLTIETAETVVDAADAERPGMGPGRYIRLAVSDTGPGIDANTKARVFEPFFTTKDAGKGTGLGLSTVYGIVKQTGGYIFVNSDRGRGTSFTLYFPYHPVTEIEPAAGVATARRTEGGTELILLVDDDRSVGEFARKALAARGYTVLLASSPEEAQHLCDITPGGIDLLFTDIVMPGMTGAALAGSLRRRYPKLKIVYTSGYTTQVTVDQGVLDPRATFIAKPFTAQSLASKVREALGEPGIGAATPDSPW